MINTRISAGFNKVQSICTCCNVTEIKLCMAKNEAESAVISLLSDKEIKNAYFEIVKGNDGFTVEFEKEYFVSCNGVMWPDAIAPVKSFDIESGVLTNVLVRFTNTVNTEAGKYSFVLALKDGEGNVIFEYTVRIKVWNFALPETYSINTAMSIIPEFINEKHGVTDEAAQKELYVKYYEFLLKYRVSAYDLPYNPLDERADKYMSDPRVTSFVLNSWADDETLKKYQEKMSSNPEWLKKATFYPVDEPLNMEHLGRLASRCYHLEQLCPDIRRTSPFFVDYRVNSTTDQLDVLIDVCDVLCPKLTCFDDDFFYNGPGYHNPELLTEKGSFLSRMDKAREGGKQVWQYVCWEPGKPYVNLYVNESGLDHRVLFWQQHLMGATGFLYWSTTWWKYVADPWTDMATVQGWLTDKVHGDGSLLYPGNKVGIDGPCASIRLETVRDGIEDCEMFLLADKALGRDWVLSKIKAVTMDVKNYTESSEFFTAVRNEIGNELEKALNK